MRRFSHKRIRDIFIRVVDSSVTQTSLAREMNVSTRTIRSDLKEIDDLLRACGNRLINDRKKGIFIHTDDGDTLAQLIEEARRPWKEIRTASERRRALLTALLAHRDGLSLAMLESEWFISIYSLKNDIALLKRHFALYDIAIIAEGGDRFRLEGSEKLLRRCLYEHLLSAREADEEYQDIFCSPTTMQDIKKILSHYFTAQGFILSDVNLRFLTLVCGIIRERIRSGQWLFDYEFAHGEPGWRSASRELLSLLTVSQKTLPDGEINFLAMHLAAFCTALPEHMEEMGFYDIEHSIMHHFLSYVSSAWFCEINYDEVMRKNLLNHIKAMRIRINNGITIVNPLIEQIKRHYPLMYEMTLAAFSELEHFFSATITDDEIGYLVMHIGAILDTPHYGAGNQKITALIVSDQGIASTRLVCQKIVKIYTDITIAQCISVEQYHAMSFLEEDIVISMADVDEKNRRVVTLSPLPERWELEKIKYYLIADNAPPMTMLNYFSDEHFFIMPGNEHVKENVIELLAVPLEINGKVDKHYLPSVLEREARASTLLDEKLAIPHPLGLVALSTMVTVAIFPQGIEWDPGKVVKLVFMLAISEDAFIDSMHIYDYLTNILDNDVIDRLSQCESFAEFIAISKKYFL
ncbi:hypothetical protein CHU32_03110 [Superficieibacter electus]|uniref:Uncharacterized protein n=2 Tax=Superficieibacter electus TaxID=2022662 RepID=A0A2P5GV51_9ENTR|nr:PTS sugar transporter subunit IIA [Superficieibacter electus]POP44411.1 hypothetical protein CHU33_13220 [Superficieibacter electus]POP50429.1 hypothetical protein CHU32_03110 [Superficieibacter electus]